MAVSKRLRYEVHRRDNFTCRYCGATPPGVKLTIDHVIPKVLGGSDTDPANLVTACADCNGGKTSSHPDAPMVAAVAEDALRWAHAVKQAQAAFMADREARQADRDTFESWWDGWGHTQDGGRRGIPKDPAWWVSVDQLIAAGLPLPALKDCIDLAMTQRKVQDENRFRYMCGVAWNKTREIQKSARSYASGGKPAAANMAVWDAQDREDAAYDQGRIDFADELLSDLGDAARKDYLDDADASEYRKEEGSEPQTKVEIYSEAASWAFSSLRGRANFLDDTLLRTLRGLPDGIGERIVNETRRDLYEDFGLLMSRGMFSGDLIVRLADEVRRPAAEAYLTAMPDEESAEWREFAIALNSPRRMSDTKLIVGAAMCAKVTAAGEYYPAMCESPGKHIQFCPTRGSFHVWINELKCCQQDGHEGHTACERHLAVLVDGHHPKYTVKDFAAIDDSTKVPF